MLLLPSQDAIEDRILLEIGKKLHAGIFKLIKNGFGKSFIWKIFTFITNGKGNVFNEYMYCTMCGKIIKYGEKFTNKIYKHACLSSTKIHSDAVRSLKFDETRTSLNAKDTRGINKDNTLIPIWQMFDLKLMEKDNKLTGLISCRTCNLVLAYDYTLSNVTQQQRHKCMEVEDEG